MRLFSCVFIVTALSLVTYGARQFLLDVPLWLEWALLPLSEGLHYMAVVFHESGHALTYILFGTPAFPALDIHHGGGATYSYGRSDALLIGLYALAVAMIWILAKKHQKQAGVLLGCMIVHAFILWRGWDLPLAMFMGHGTEVLVACWCFYRACDQKKILGTPEKCVSLVFGLHLAGRTLLLAAALLFYDMRRLSYGVQKNKKGSADLDKLAVELGVSMETAALLLLVFMTIAFALTFALLYKRRSAKAS